MANDYLLWFLSSFYIDEAWLDAKLKLFHANLKWLDIKLNPFDCCIEDSHWLDEKRKKEETFGICCEYCKGLQKL